MAVAKDEIVRVVREVIAPLIQADGGDLYLVSVEDTGVSLHVTGRFSGCPGNTLARRRVIELEGGKVTRDQSRGVYGYAR